MTLASLFPDLDVLEEAVVTVIELRAPGSVQAPCRIVVIGSIPPGSREKDGLFLSAVNVGIIVKLPKTKKTSCVYKATSIEHYVVFKIIADFMFGIFS